MVVGLTCPSGTLSLPKFLLHRSLGGGPGWGRPEQQVGQSQVHWALPLTWAGEEPYVIPVL